MKRILLTSTALVAFAGAAAAEITFSGSADLGYNNITATGGNDNNLGFYSDLDITATFSQALDNGLTVGASLDLEDLGTSDNGQSYTLSLTSDTAGLHFGQTEYAAVTHWSAVGDMAADGFSEQDDEAVLRGDVTFGNVDMSVSYNIDGGALDGDLNQLSLGASASFGSVDVAFGYQEAGVAPTPVSGTAADFNTNEILGLSASTTYGAADIALGYASNSTTGEDSIGISVAYPVGPVTLSGSYVDNSLAGERWDVSAAYASGPVAVELSTDEGASWALEGSYDVGNGLTIFAGLADAGEDMYVAGQYDLGSGASLLVSFADDADADNGDDEIGANDYQEGTTVELSFEF